jgi:EAL domain-containing protein (putative c-di-GMP-specific phosphodiesterase class I)
VQRITDAHLDPKKFVVEVTERRITDTAELILHAAQLQRLGVRIALDDAGSGYAGLEILGKLPLDFVKIDRLIIVNAMTDPGPRGVLAGIVTIARETNTSVIAEGIENTQMLAFLQDLPEDLFSGIHAVQGYLFGRPEIGYANTKAWSGSPELRRASRIMRS